MRSFIQKIWTFVTLRKFTSAFIAILILIVGYYGYKSFFAPATPVKYVMTTVEKGTLTTSVSGSGQVSVSNQVDIKAETEGKVVSIAVKNGQEVKAGAILVKLDSSDAERAVRDAALGLQSAKLSMDKLKKPATADTILQAENSLKSAQDSLAKLKLAQPIDYQVIKDAKQKAQDNLDKAYEDSFNAISDSFFDLPTIITGIEDVLYDSGAIGSGQNIDAIMNEVEVKSRDDLQIFQDTAKDEYATARKNYDTNLEAYKKSTRYSENAVITSLVDQTIATVKSMAQAAKSENDYLAAWLDYKKDKDQDAPAIATQYQANLQKYITTLNTHLDALTTIQRTLQDNTESLTTSDNDLKTMDQNNPLDLSAAEATVAQKQAALDDLKNGADELDLKAQEISVEQKANSLADAQDTLSKCTVRAPFDGVVAKADYFKTANSVSSGSVVATIITKQNVAKISLNEVDVSKVKVGQKAVLTFDAIEDLEISGEVIDVDTLATVSQNVVTYTAVILLDTQDERVRSGMSTSATIITEVKQDILLIPSSAIQAADDGSSYVEAFSGTLPDDTTGEGITSATMPSQKTIEIGISDDTSTEIISGLSEGDKIVLKTVTDSTTSKTTKTSSTKSGGMGMLGGGPPN